MKFYIILIIHIPLHCQHKTFRHTADVFLSNNIHAVAGMQGPPPPTPHNKSVIHNSRHSLYIFLHVLQQSKRSITLQGSCIRHLNSHHKAKVITKPYEWEDENSIEKPAGVFQVQPCYHNIRV